MTEYRYGFREHTFYTERDLKNATQAVTRMWFQGRKWHVQEWNDGDDDFVSFSIHRPIENSWRSDVAIFHLPKDQWHDHMTPQEWIATVNPGEPLQTIKVDVPARTSGFTQAVPTTPSALPLREVES